VVECAARLFRRYGYNGVGIDDIMAAANLTRGGFYAHFRSKEDLFAATLAADLVLAKQLRARCEADAGGGASAALRELIDFYLDRDNRTRIPNLCSLVSLSADVGRSGEAARAAYTAALRNMIDELARRIGMAPAEAQTRALTAVALCVGGVVLAQAVNDGQLASALLDACRARALAEVEAPEMRAPPSHRRPEHG
jgi:AcrR family transcriptional regulator